MKDGYIEQTNFDTYNSMRIAEMPKVESIVMPSGGFWGGVGEPTICVAATGGAQRLFRGDGQAHPLGAAAGPEHHLRLTLTRRPRWPPQPYRKPVHGCAAPDDAEKRRWRHRGGGGSVRLPLPVPRPIRRPNRGDRRRLWRGELRAGAKTDRCEAAGDADRTEPDFCRLSVQQ